MGTDTAYAAPCLKITYMAGQGECGYKVVLVCPWKQGDPYQSEVGQGEIDFQVFYLIQDVISLI